MQVIAGEKRKQLQDLVAQMNAHGSGGGSASLAKAMAAFGAMNTHELAINLATMLLSLEITTQCSGGGKGSAS